MMIGQESGQGPSSPPAPPTRDASSLGGHLSEVAQLRGLLAQVDPNVSRAATACATRSAAVCLLSAALVPPAEPAGMSDATEALRVAIDASDALYRVWAALQAERSSASNANTDRVTRLTQRRHQIFNVLEDCDTVLQKQLSQLQEFARACEDVEEAASVVADAVYGVHRDSSLQGLESDGGFEQQDDRHTPDQSVQRLCEEVGKAVAAVVADSDTRVAALHQAQSMELARMQLLLQGSPCTTSEGDAHGIDCDTTHPHADDTTAFSESEVMALRRGASDALECETAALASLFALDGALRDIPSTHGTPSEPLRLMIRDVAALLQHHTSADGVPEGTQSTHPVLGQVAAHAVAVARQARDGHEWATAEARHTMDCAMQVTRVVQRWLAKAREPQHHHAAMVPADEAGEQQSRLVNFLSSLRSALVTSLVSDDVQQDVGDDARERWQTPQWKVSAGPPSGSPASDDAPAPSSCALLTVMGTLPLHSVEALCVFAGPPSPGASSYAELLRSHPRLLTAVACGWVASSHPADSTQRSVHLELDDTRVTILTPTAMIDGAAEKSAASRAARLACAVAELLEEPLVSDNSNVTNATMKAVMAALNPGTDAADDDPTHDGAARGGSSAVDTEHAAACSGRDMLLALQRVVLDGPLCDVATGSLLGELAADPASALARGPRTVASLLRRAADTAAPGLASSAALIVAQHVDVASPAPCAQPATTLVGRTVTVSPVQTAPDDAAKDGMTSPTARGASRPLSMVSGESVNRRMPAPAKPMRQVQTHPSLAALPWDAVQELSRVLNGANHCVDGTIEVVGASVISNPLVQHAFRSRLGALAMEFDTIGAPAPLPHTAVNSDAAASQAQGRNVAYGPESVGACCSALSNVLRLCNNGRLGTCAAGDDDPRQIGDCNVQVFLHGTSPTACKEIVLHGFDERVAAGGTKSLFGSGTYMTNSFCKAHQYATPLDASSATDLDALATLESIITSSGSAFDVLPSAAASARAPTTAAAAAIRPMILSSAALGDCYITTQPLRGVRRPPSHSEVQRSDGHTPSKSVDPQRRNGAVEGADRRFDSVMGNGKKHNEFVVYDRSQLRPEVVLWYRVLSHHRREDPPTTAPEPSATPRPRRRASPAPRATQGSTRIGTPSRTVTTPPPQVRQALRTTSPMASRRATGTPPPPMRPSTTRL